MRLPDPFYSKMNSIVTSEQSAHMINAYNCYKKEQEKLFLAKFAKITNIKTHNLSTCILTQLQLVVLGLGPKFLTKDYTTKEIVRDKVIIALTHLQRKIQLGMFFSDEDGEKLSIPKNETKEKWLPPRKPYDRIIEEYIKECDYRLVHEMRNKVLQRDDNDRILIKTLKSLSNNKNIVIKPADKNLGITIINKIDYDVMCYTHLNDITTYVEIINYSPDESYATLIDLLKTYKQYYKYPHDTVRISKLASSLLQLKDHPTLRIALFYCLPKIHKRIIPPIPGRPIVSSVNTLTYHASVYLDLQLQPILKQLYNVCTSALTLITDFQDLQTDMNSVILCADVTALYPNIPILLGVQTVAKVLNRLHCFTDSHLNFLMDLLHWVLLNNFCTFNSKTYLQIKGTDMGTPVAPSYANIFLYGIECDVIAKHKPVYYKRYIDDIFAIFHSKIIAKCFVHTFNNIVPSIKLEAITIGRKGIMLDLEIELTYNANTNLDIIQHTLFQKPANIYQYIPLLSNHRPTIFLNFIKQEINRFNINCTNINDFNICKTLFLHRLLARGYNEELFNNALSALPTRSTLLNNIIVRRNLVKKAYDKSLLILEINKPLFSHVIAWNNIFKLTDALQNHPAFIDSFHDYKLVIGTKNDRSIGSYIIKSKSI